MTYLIRFLLNVLRSVFLPFRLYARWAWARGEPRWISVDIKGRVVQFRGEGGPLERLTAPAREQTSLEGLRTLARHAGRDPMVRGVLIHLPPLEAGWATCESLREIVAQLRAAGKQVVCHLSQGGGNRELYVALAAERIYMAPYASFGPLGLALQPLYFRPLLDRLGVRIQAIATGEYKSAAEAGMRENMSDAAREQLDALLSAKHHALTQALATRGLSEQEINELFERALVLSHEASTRRVIDGVLYEDELPATLQTLAGSTLPADKAPQPIAAAKYLRLKKPLWLRLKPPERIAVIPLHGMITGETGSVGVGLRHSTLAPVLRGLAKDPEVRAIVLHIDSPGGSALTSELMHREIKQLAAKKPVIACFGEVAASGGYYLACACNKIVARDLCTTGSIGVVMVNIEAQGLFAQLGLRPQFLRTADSADMLSTTRGLSEREHAILSGHVAELYRRFLTVAAEGRGQSLEAIDTVARGRVWTGSAAKDKGLVDAIGDIERALSEARELVPELSTSERADLRPHVYRLKSGRSFGLRALLLGPWLPLLKGMQDLTALSSLQREAALYYAPPHEY